LRNSRSFTKPGAGYLAFVVAAALTLGAASIWSPKLVAPAHAQVPPPAQTEIAGAQSVATSRSTTRFSDAASQPLRVQENGVAVAIHRPLAGRAGAFQDEDGGFAAGNDNEHDSGAREDAGRSSHRVRKANFPGGTDNGAVTPPDTQGAVGPNHLMAVLNSNVTIQTRTGTVLSSVPIASFWSSLGGINEAFDPRVLFDRYANRWIVSAAANAVSASAYILVAVSQTNDPTAGWNLYKVKVSANGSSWADYPTLGFNGDWIVVQANVFTISQGAFVASNIYAFNKADLYAGGAGQYAVFHDPTGFTDYPAVTHDNTIPVEYLARTWNGAGGTLRISTITGPVGAEVLTIGVAFPKGSRAWQASAAVNFAPQLGSSARIDTDDDRIADGVFPRHRDSHAIGGAVVADQYSERQRRRRAATWSARRSVGTVRLRVPDARRQRQRRHDDRLLAIWRIAVRECELLVSPPQRSAEYAGSRHRLQGGRGAVLQRLRHRRQSMG
jgi:hypothetical protein